MSAPFRLESSRVVIVGLGLMGGSLAFALKNQCKELVACDPDPRTVALARQMAIADQVETESGAVLPGADLVLLAAPVRAIIELIEEMPYLHPGSAVVIDIGSTKKDICTAFGGLPERFDPLGGHPMCGKAAAGLVHADANLFQKAVFAFTPIERTSEHARSAGEQIARAIGASPLWIDADTHDRWVAATSHLPYLSSLALVLATPLEAAPLVGPGFRSSSRLAGSSVRMMEDVLMTNRDNVLAALGIFQDYLQILQEILIQQDVTRLRSLMHEGAIHQTSLNSSAIKGQSDP